MTDARTNLYDQSWHGKRDHGSMLKREWEPITKRDDWRQRIHEAMLKQRCLEVLKRMQNE